MNEISKEQLLYMKRTRQHKQFVLFFQLFLFIFFIILWEITSRAGIINAFIFSSPSRMLASGKELLLNGQLLKHLGITLAETFASFFLVTAVSLFTAILLWWNNTLSEILEPYFVILNSLPKSAMAPIFIVWLGNNMKTIIVGISGSVAAYKTCDLVRALKKSNYDIEVIMTENATKFISPLTLGALINKPVLVDDFDDQGYQIKHISYAKKADCFIIVPATANIIGKIANGVCDDIVTSTFLAATCPKLIAPAMNVNMYDNLATQRNIERCKTYGIKFVEPGYGLLACGDVGRGKLADTDDIINMVEYCLSPKPLKHKRVLVTAGPTQEAIDPVRYITNHSSGKMGYALAKRAYQLGAKVTLISGPTDLRVPYGVEVINIKSARAMFEAVKESYEKQDYIIKAAAVGDYRVKEIATNKIKKHEDSLILEMVKNDDILTYLGAHKTTQTICGFAMETQNLIENAKDKFKRKNCDLLVANNLNENGAGFKKDTNKVTFISKNDVQSIELMSKDELSDLILKKLIKIKESHSC